MNGSLRSTRGTCPSSGYDFPFFALSGPEFADIRSRVDAFAHIAAYRFSDRNLTRGDGEAERVLTMAVTAEFFDVLGVKPVRGRVFTDEEAQRGDDACVAVLAHDASGTAARAIGSTIRLDDAPCEVIGVLPEGFGFRDDRVRVWTALPVDLAETPSNRQSHPLVAVARLRPDISADQADAQLQSLAAHWSENVPRSLRQRTLRRSAGRSTRTSSATSATRCCCSAAPCSSCC